jgi:hypothetical protein
MIIYARKVEVVIQPRGRRLADYYDLVKLDFGPHKGEYAIVDPICPSTQPNFIRELLTPEEALRRLHAWPHAERPDGNGSVSQVTMDGQRWLKAATVH